MIITWPRYALAPVPDPMAASATRSALWYSPRLAIRKHVWLLVGSASRAEVGYTGSGAMLVIFLR